MGTETPSDSGDWSEALSTIIEDFTEAFDANERYELLFELIWGFIEHFLFLDQNKF